jgi:type I restriction enzyme R subunit
MSEGTKEIHFEEHIAKYLTRNLAPNFSEYILKDSSSYDKDLCLIPLDLIGFLEDTRPQKMDALRKQYGTDLNKKVLERVSDELNKYKTLHVFREKVRDRGQILDLVFFKPSNSKSP